MATTPTRGLVLTNLDATVQFFCDQGIADSTSKTYQSSLRKFSNVCELYSILTPFPVSESIYASYLASQNLSPQTIKTYLAGIRHMLITLGLPEPKAYSSLPRLRLVQAGIKGALPEDTTGSETKVPHPSDSAADLHIVVGQSHGHRYNDALGCCDAMLLRVLPIWRDNSPNHA